MTLQQIHIHNSADSASPRVDQRQPLRVCHISMTLLTGGLERLLVEIGRHCDSRDFQLHFVTLDQVGQPARDLEELGWPVSVIKTSSRQSKWGRLTSLTSLLKDGSFDVIHSHNTLAHFYAAVAAKWAGVPVVVNTQHGRGCGSSWKARMQFRIANLLTDQIIGVSEDATELCRRDDPISRRRMQAIWNGIDLKRFAFTGPQQNPIGISVARLSPEKDIETLLRATSLVIKSHPDFRLKLIGDGPERERLHSLREQLALGSHVEFLGERHDVPSLLSSAGFFVSSSRSEGISLTLLEAMAVGLPIVATDVGGNPEIILDGQTGRLVPSKSPETLAAAMCDMLADPTLWNLYGTLGRQRVEDQFNITYMVARYEQLYRDLVHQRQLHS